MEVEVEVVEAELEILRVLIVRILVSCGVIYTCLTFVLCGIIPGRTRIYKGG